MGDAFALSGLLTLLESALHIDGHWSRNDVVSMRQLAHPYFVFEVIKVFLKFIFQSLDVLVALSDLILIV